MREVKRLDRPRGHLQSGCTAKRRSQAHLVHIKHTPIIGDDTTIAASSADSASTCARARTFTLTPRHRIVGTDGARIPQAGEAGVQTRHGRVRLEGRDTCVADGLCGTVVRRDQRGLPHGPSASRDARPGLEQLGDLAARRFALVEEVLRRGVSRVYSRRRVNEMRCYGRQSRRDVSSPIAEVVAGVHTGSAPRTQ